MKNQKGIISAYLLGFIIVAIIGTVGVAHAQEDDAIPPDEMDQVFALLEAQAEALEQLNNAVFGMMSVMTAEAPTTQPVVIPPDEPVLALTAPRRVVLPQEGRYAKPLYIEEAPEVLPVTTRVFEVPTGYTMELIQHEPKYVLTSYDQPATYEAVPINAPVQIQPITGDGVIDSITIIVDEPLQPVTTQ